VTPKGEREVLKTFAAASLLIALPSVAAALTGRCVLEVDRKSYLDGPCNIEMGPDGSFSIGAGEQSRSEFFAYVNLAPAAAKATGYWNGPEAASHAHDSLGALSRNGACWVNSRARVCAWRVP
jgi:hypothetical protein